MENVSTVFIGLTGGIVGAVLTFLFQYLIKNRELKLRIFEKTFERKWEAQNHLIGALNLFLREEGHELYVDKYGDPMFFASILKSRKVFIRSLNELRRTWEETRYLIEAEAASRYMFFDFYLDYLREDLENADNSYNSIFVGHILFDEISDLAEDISNQIWSDMKFQMKNPTKFALKKEKWIDPKVELRMKKTELYSLENLYHNEIPKQPG